MMLHALLLASALASASPEPTRISAPVGYSTEHITGLALSPDGAQVAFVVRRIDTWLAVGSTREPGNVRVLPDTKDAENPFWSPDGRSLAYFRRGELWRIDSEGGESHRICACAGIHGSWGIGGTILFSTREPGPILLIPDHGEGRPHPVTTLDRSLRESAHGTPEFLPDGVRFLFRSSSNGFVSETERTEPASRILIASVEPGSRKLVVEDADEARLLDPQTVLFQRRQSLYRIPLDGGTSELLAADSGAFSANGAGACIRAQASPPTELVWLDRKGKTVGRLTSPGSYARPRISPDGRLAAYTDTSSGAWSTVVVLIATGKVLWRFPAAMMGAAWSRDSRRLAFPLRVDETCATAVANVRTGALRRVSAECNQMMDWSPDGHAIVTQGPLGRPESFLFIAASGVGPASTRRLGPLAYQGWLRFAPDGGSAAFDAAPEDRRDAVGKALGGYNVFVASLQKDAKPISLSPAGGYRPTWRADGRELFYVDAGRMLVSVPMKRRVKPKQTRLFIIPSSNNPYADYDVMPDGSRFLISRELDALLFTDLTNRVP